MAERAMVVAALLGVQVAGWNPEKWRAYFREPHKLQAPLVAEMDRWLADGPRPERWAFWLDYFDRDGQIRRRAEDAAKCGVDFLRGLEQHEAADVAARQRAAGETTALAVGAINHSHPDQRAEYLSMLKERGVDTSVLERHLQQRKGC